MNIIGMIAVLFFAVLGAASFAAALMRLYDADDKTSLTLDDLTAQSAEARIRHAARLCDRIRCQRLLCRCRDEEAERICENLMKEFRIIEII